jgi:gliding motility-associated-like protein
MKILCRAIIFSALSLAFNYASGQILRLDWAEGLNTSTGYTYYSQSIVNDNEGNLYIASQFYGTYDVDPGPGTYKITSVGSVANLFIAKFKASGELSWVKQIVAEPDGTSRSISIDKSAHLYITGMFKDTVDFDPGNGVYKLIADTGARDMFILKLDSAGNFIWVKQLKGNEATFPTGIAFDSLANPVITGYFAGTTDFDPGPGSSIETSLGNTDIFIMKLDSSGIYQWSKHLGNAGNDGPWGLILDHQDNIMIYGSYTGPADLDPGPGVLYLNSIGLNYNILFIKLNSSGNIIRAWNLGCPDGYQSCTGIALDAFDNLYACGLFSGEMDMDPGSGIYNLKSDDSLSGFSSAFLVKYDSSSKLIWAKKPVKASRASVYRMCSQPLQGLYLTGSFRDSADFNPGGARSVLYSNGAYDAFIVNCDFNGALKWVKQIGGKKSEYDFSLSVDSLHLYLAGQFEDSVDFDPDTSSFYLNQPVQSIFIAKWNECATQSFVTLNGCDSLKINNSVYRASGKYKQVIPNYASCDSIITLNLTIVKKPRALFTLQSQPGCQYVAYAFTDSSFADTASASGFEYHWSFGDGNQAIYHSGKLLHNFSHTYTKTGSYDVKLVFSNGFCMDSFSILNQVYIQPAPKPGFNLSVHSGCTPVYLKISDTLTADLVTKEYDFGSGFFAVNNKTVFDTTISILNPGKFFISQRLLGTTGCVTQYEDSVTIIPGLTLKDTVEVLYTTVLDSSTTFTRWKKMPFAVSYSINGKIVKDTFYNDINATPAMQSMEYYISGVDSCGDKSQSSPAAKTIYLKGDNFNFNEYAVLKYTPYETWRNGVLKYQVEYFNARTGSWERLNAIPGNILEAKTEALPDSSDLDINSPRICYRIKAIEQNGNYQESISNVSCIPLYPVVFLPNAFSPNGDGKNDFYKPYCVGLSIYVFEIYNRWGELMYSDHPGSKGWDGTFKGKPAEAGTYLYRLSAIGQLNSPATTDARVIERKGWIELVK